MYNLRRLGGTYKGYIGEIIAKNHIADSIITKHKSFWEFKNYGNPRISQQKLDFLEKYWKRLDIIKPLYNENKDVVDIELYEIKVKNHYPRIDNDPKANKLKKFPSINKGAIELYKRGIELGFNVKIVKIVFFDNWRYNLLIRDFKSQFFSTRDLNNPL